jgi:hypothetical protein
MYELRMSYPNGRFLAVILYRKRVFATIVGVDTEEEAKLAFRRFMSIR